FAQALAECLRQVRAGEQIGGHIGYSGRLGGRFRRPRLWPDDCGASCKAEDQLAPSHSMTSSARARIAGGIVRPSAEAVLRLMTNWYLEACSTARSAGFAPLRILSM